jgi:hypothetical protein
MKESIIYYIICASVPFTTSGSSGNSLASVENIEYCITDSPWNLVNWNLQIIHRIELENFVIKQKWTELKKLKENVRTCVELDSIWWQN